MTAKPTVDRLGDLQDVDLSPAPNDGDALIFDVPTQTWIPGAGGAGGGGVSDHGALTGLGDDDHPQYHNDARGDARYQPVDTDLTAIAALSTTAFGRALLTLADAAALLVASGGAAASHLHSGADVTTGTVAEARIDAAIARDAEVSAAIAALSTVYQPLDSDLTSIAALATTAFGRSLLTLADAAALLAAAGAQASDADLTAIAGLLPANDDVIQRKAGAWTNRTMAQLIADLGALGTTFQPLDSDLTAIAALATTAYGRSLLEAANAGALRTLAGLVIGTDVPSQAAFDDHSARHEDGGADEISVQGLSGTPAALQAHIDDTLDAHDASAISVADSGGFLTATDVEAALAEIADKLGRYVGRVDNNTSRTLSANSTWEDIGSTSVTFTAKANRVYRVTLEASWQPGTVNWLGHHMRCLADGATTGVTPTDHRVASRNSDASTSDRWHTTVSVTISGLAAGARTVKWQSQDNGTSMDRTFTDTHVTVEELAA